MSKESLVFTRYGQLKFMIKQATTDQVLEDSRPPEHKHSVANKGVDNAFNHSTSESALQHRGHSNARERYSEPGRSKGLLSACKKFAGNADDVVNNGAPRDVNTMHKAEIEDDIEQLKHHLHMYDSKFLRAHNRLAKLKQDYQISKGSIFITRYGLLKGMIKVVTQDTSLKPD
ncbi:hypothetical protein FSP39_010847 [Pinctada imbricata]|uniref:Uncharacterized protein n=1 Tax=Pinctada imbricata TaxID=66713 RepID=A0AA89C139_PINIB|nr:hypothetical protein FSP39_010847 [Pinctada imbricata]